MEKIGISDKNNKRHYVFGNALFITSLIVLNWMFNIATMFNRLRQLNIFFYLRIFRETWKGNLIITVMCLFCLSINHLVYKLSKSTPEIGTNKGTAKWANESIESLKNDPKKLAKFEKLVYIRHDDMTPKERGMILHVDDEGAYVDVGTRHNAVLGITGAFKTQTSAFPFIELLSRPAPAGYEYVQESMVINDTKGEICASTSDMLKKRGYDVKIINLDKPYYSQGYDPYKLIKESYLEALNECDDDLQGDFSEVMNLVKAFSMILTNDPGATEKFWQNTARDLISGIVMATLEDLMPNYEEWVSPYLTQALLKELDTNYVTVEEDKQIKKLDWYFNERELGNRAKTLASTTISAPDKQRGSTITTAMDALSLFVDDGIAKLTSTNDIDFEEIIEKPTAIFLICPDDNESRWALASLFVEQSRFALNKIIKSKYQGKSPRRINYILEEFGQMPEIPKMETKMSMDRGRNIRYTIYLQDYSQLDILYDKRAKAIKNNCSNTIYLLTTDESTAKEIKSKLDVMTVSAESVSQRDNESHSSTTTSEIEKPLMFLSELLKLPDDEGVVLRAGLAPIYSKFRFAYEFMDMTPKDIQDLAGKGSHAKINLSRHNDYLIGKNAIDKYRASNLGLQVGDDVYENFDYESIEVETKEEELKAILYEELARYGMEMFEIYELFEDDEFKILLADHAFTGSTSTTALKKNILKLVKKRRH